MLLASVWTSIIISHLERYKMTNLQRNTAEYDLSNNVEQQRRNNHRRIFIEMSRKSLPYQIIKYVLLILNIMIVATTAIISIIVSLLPSIIYEKKLQFDNISQFFRTGNILFNEQAHSQMNINKKYDDPMMVHENDIIRLTAQEIDNIRLIRFVILGLAAMIILNQTLSVFGLFKERSFYILISTVIIGLIGQLSLFVLPASIFILITIHIIFSLCYVITLNHLNLMAKESNRKTRSPSRSSIYDLPTSKHCCCRCKTCICNHPIDTGGKQTYQNVSSYYYGSLGRKNRDSRQIGQYQSIIPSTAIKSPPNDNFYAQRLPYRASPFKPAKISGNLNLIDRSQSIYPNSSPRKELIPIGNYFEFERSKNSNII